MPRSIRGRSSGLQAAAHRLRRRPCGPAWTPETSAAPGRQEATGQAQGPAPGRRTAPRLGRPSDMVTTERVIYQQRCNDPLSLPTETVHDHETAGGSPADALAGQLGGQGLGQGREAELVAGLLQAPGDDPG